VDKKKKKLERSQLIKDLQEVQVPETELALLTSLSTIQVYLFEVCQKTPCMSNRPCLTES